MTCTHAQEIDVRLTKSQSIKVIQDLIACDAVQREVKIILNTLQTKDQMLAVRQLQIGELNNEIEKRDDIISRMEYEFELKSKMNDNLQKQIIKLERTKKINKWFYFAAGLGTAIGLITL